MHMLYHGLTNTFGCNYPSLGSKAACVVHADRAARLCLALPYQVNRAKVAELALGVMTGKKGGGGGRRSSETILGFRVF